MYLYLLDVIQEKDGYISRLQHESDGLRRRLSDVASVREMH